MPWSAYNGDRAEWCTRGRTAIAHDGALRKTTTAVELGDLCMAVFCRRTRTGHLLTGGRRSMPPTIVSHKTQQKDSENYGGT